MSTSDIDRLLRHAARTSVERLESQRAPVDPAAVAARIVQDHVHLTPVRARRAELQVSLADFVRELRARAAESADPS